MKMKKIIFQAILFLVLPVITSSQPLRKQQYDITKEKVLYTIGYAHLDTQWNWDYPTTINQYIKNTMEDNFKLFEKYPDYVFNFTGSRRYNMMREYYPESYKKVKEYIGLGRWNVSGSSVDEGEVNISSSESVLRQVLYGNIFFKREFNKESIDYMLPDCFGFVATMPSVWSHAGLLGFSTQKLTWRSANGVPFNVGLWEGPDGKSIIAALNATDYTGRVVNRLDKDSIWNARLNDDINKYGLMFDYRYYGVGDVGGAPRDADVRNATGSLPQADSKFKVVLTSSDQMYKDITPEIRAKLPTYSGDLLLIEHSAGSMSSESYMKRANRKNEALAKSSEQVAVIADWLGGAAYPFEKLNRSWELVLGSQFHDILPGTSIPKAYEYAWNDEFIAMNGFSEVTKNSVSTISGQLNTMVDGRAVVVYNPVAIEREDVVTAELSFTKPPVNLKVLDKNGNIVPSQVIATKGNNLTVLFLAKLPSAGLSVFGISETDTKPLASTLSVTDNSLENSFFKVRIDVNGDISSIYDKRAAREVLSKPASLQFQYESPSAWPSWNMDWNDRQKPPIDFMNKDVTVKIVEQGPVRVALEVTKKGRNSIIKQIISLSSGDAGKIIEIRNKIDWQSKEVSLKASFPTTVVNEFATYGLNTAAVKRTTNNDVKFEVPGRQWIDISDRSNNYGVSILEDCKYGSDKPDNNTLRLTLMYTPRANTFVYQGTQDWGIHDVKYGIYAHVGDWVYAKTPWQGSFLNNPPIAFETSKHDGNLGKEISIIKINTSQVDIMALKKAEESEGYYIVRVNELYGKDANNVIITFPAKIADSYEVNGQEKKIGSADFSEGRLNFNMTRFLIRSFAIKLEDNAMPVSKPVQLFAALPFNEDGFSFDNNRKDGNIVDKLTIPAEMIPSEVVSEDIHFSVGNKADGQLNILAAKGQKINLPAGVFNKVYILAAATEDTQGEFKAGNQTFRINIQNWSGYVGQHYNRVLYFNNLKVASVSNAFTKRDNIAWFASHRHTPTENDTYQYSYLYKYEINLPKGAGSITLPVNNKIKIIAITVANNKNDNVTPLQLLYDDFKDNQPFDLRVKEYVTPDLHPVKYKLQPLFPGKIDERMIPRIKTFLRDNDLDTIMVSTTASGADYADVSSANKVTATYYATGRSTNGREYFNEKIDISNIFNSQSGRLKDTVIFDNGEGRILIDLQKPLIISRINIFIDQFWNRGSQIFTIWTSDNINDITGDPKTKGWKYTGIYGLQERSPGSTGVSYIFNNNLTCRYIMFLTDGSWHGSDYLRQLDIFEQK
jgi:alpha-mannosidase